MILPFVEQSAAKPSGSAPWYALHCDLGPIVFTNLESLMDSIVFEEVDRLTRDWGHERRFYQHMGPWDRADPAELRAELDRARTRKADFLFADIR